MKIRFLVSIVALFFQAIDCRPVHRDERPLCNMTVRDNLATTANFFKIGNKPLAHQDVLIEVTSAHPCAVDYTNITISIRQAVDDGAYIYLKMVCKNPIDVTFTNVDYPDHSNNTLNLLPIGYFWPINCRISWQEIATFGNNVDLRVLFLQGWADPDPEWVQSQLASSVNSTENQTLPLVPRGLENIGSLLMSQSPCCNGSISDIFTKFVWPVMAEFTFYNCAVSTFPGDELQLTMPKLQSLQLPINRIRKLPSFPWQERLLDLPRGLQRTITGNDHYSEGTRVKPNVYRRFYHLDYNPLGDDLSYNKFRGTIDKISLQHCRISAIGSECFKFTSGLQSLDIRHNSLIVLPATLFHNLTSLKELQLSFNKLNTINRGLFVNLPALVNILLNNNNINFIDTDSFADLNSLQRMDVSANNITHFADDAFSTENQEIQLVNISHNNMKTLPKWVFLLRKINIVDCSNNKIDFEGIVRTLSVLNLQELDYQNTKSVSQFGTRRRLQPKKVLLANNQLHSLDARLIDTKRNALMFMLLLYFYDLDLGKEQIACDCTTRYMALFLTKNQNLTLFMEKKMSYAHANWVCSWPPDILGKPIVSVSQSRFRCIIEDKACPRNCECTVREVTGAVVVDCSNRNIDSLPSMLPGNTTELYLQINHIASIDKEYSYMSQLTILNISNNAITALRYRVVHKFKQLKELYMDNNRLTALPSNIKDLSLDTVTLSNNDIKCDCNALWLKGWILKNIFVIKDYQNVVCAAGLPQGMPLISADNHLFICETDPAKYAAISLSVIFIVSAIVVVIVYWKRKMIKLFLFTRFNLHPFDNTKEYLSRLKYDAFISYCADDYKWVCFDLRQRLEHLGYRLCLHDRDFMPGAPIEENILGAVKDSRRMILYLTNSYLASDWCMLEFRAAHQKVLRHDSNYLILLLAEDVAVEDIKDPNLLLYLDTYTYLGMDNKWFWDKLHYAMPTLPLMRVPDLDLQLEPLPGLAADVLNPPDMTTKRVQMTHV